jgi:hypothetical protein
LSAVPRPDQIAPRAPDPNGALPSVLLRRRRRSGRQSSRRSATTSGPALPWTRAADGRPHEGAAGTGTADGPGAGASWWPCSASSRCGRHPPCPSFDHREPDALGVGLTLLGARPVAARSRFPLPALAVACAAALIPCSSATRKGPRRSPAARALQRSPRGARRPPARQPPSPCTCSSGCSCWWDRSSRP